MAITRLNNNSITSITALPSGVGGKILQVVGTPCSGTQTNTAGTEEMISNYVAQITPSSTSSKIFAMFSGAAQVSDNNSAPFNVFFKMRANVGSAATTSSTELQAFRYGAYDYNSAAGTVEEHSPLIFSYLYSPSTTSAVHFGLSVGNYDGNPTWKVGMSSYVSHWTLMEIGT
tara:strand:- start:249 stop:767 length:519 start_codon:yes stop_codon:yes gene_type:complete